MQSIMVNGILRRMNEKEEVFRYGLMVAYMKDTGKEIKQMEKED